MQVLGIGWAGAITEQYAAMQTFFQQNMGLSLEHELNDKEISHYRLPSGQLLEVYGASIRQRSPAKAEHFDGHSLGFEVDSLEQMRAHMIKHGAHFLEEIKHWEDEAWCGFIGPGNSRLQIQNVGRRSAPNVMGIQSVSWVGLPAEDFDETVHFFTHVMGMIPCEPRNGDLSAQFSLSNGEQFEILGPDHPWQAHLMHVTLGFEVEDIDKTRMHMEEATVEFITPIETTPDGRIFTFFRDLDDYRYALWKPTQS